MSNEAYFSRKFLDEQEEVLPFQFMTDDESSSEINRVVRNQKLALRADDKRSIRIAEVDCDPDCDPVLALVKEHRNKWRVSSLFVVASLAATTILLPHQPAYSSYLVNDENNAVFEEHVGSDVLLNRTSTSIDVEAKTNQGLANEVKQLVQKICLNAKHEDFQDGIKTDFRNSLGSLIKKYEDAILIVLTDFFNDPFRDVETLAEVLMVVGNNSQYLSRHNSFQFINLGLLDNEPIIRDSAALAFSDIDDPSVIPFLQKAIEREKFNSLKKDFQDIIDELEEA